MTTRLVSSFDLSPFPISGHAIFFSSPITFPNNEILFDRLIKSTLYPNTECLVQRFWFKFFWMLLKYQTKLYIYIIKVLLEKNLIIILDQHSKYCIGIDFYEIRMYGDIIVTVFDSRYFFMCSG